MNALQNDLARLTTGEVFTDPVTREVYATAACIYRIVPRAVVRPREPEEVAAIVAYAASCGIPVTARGAGTAVAGQSLGSGIIIDFKAHLDAVLELDREARIAKVMPGLVLGTFNRQLAPLGLRFPPDPSSGDYATIGGMIANNSSGPHSLKYGDTRQWTRRLKVVLADGSVTWLDQKPALPRGIAASDNLENRVYARLPELLEKHRDDIEQSRPRVNKNSSGYFVWDLAGDRQLNPTPLIVGSEGTLAVVIKAELALGLLPAARAGALISLASIEDVGEAMRALLPLGPAALEIMDHLFIATVREHRPDLRRLLPEDARAVLLIEFEAGSREQAGQLLAETADACKAALPARHSLILAENDDDVDSLFEVRKAASPILYRLPGRRLTRFIEDVVIPPDRIGEGITRVQQILKAHGTEAPVLGHAGSGNLHLNPRLDLEKPEDRQRMVEIAEQIYAAVIEMGGSITGEHGDGILRAPFVKRQFPLLVPLFHQIKELFDPDGILNPGKILAEADAAPTDMLRFGGGGPGPGRYTQLGRDDLREMLLRCHGCGLCRTYCTVVAATGDERAMPRAKVSLLRAVWARDLDPDSPEVHEELERVLSLCTGCQRCVTSCPTGIEPARLIRAFLDDHYRLRGRPLRESIFAKAPALLAASTRASRAAAALIHGRAARFVMQAGLSIRKDAPLPRPAPDATRGFEAGSESSAGGVLFYPGCLGRYADHEKESTAAYEILKRLSYDVIVPDLPCCGQAKLGAGDLAGAAREAWRLADMLSEYIERGFQVVTACPACALAFQHEYAALIGSKAEKPAANAFELFQFLDRAAHEKAIEDLRLRKGSGKILLHRPCHNAALEKTDHVARVLSRIAGLEIVLVDDACCGLAGPHGLRLENAPVSKALARSLAAAAQAAQTAAIASACPSCRLQIRALGFEPQSPAVILSNCLAEK